PNQQTLSGSNCRHRLVPLPVYGTSPRQLSDLFIGAPVYVAFMVVADEHTAVFGPTKGTLTLLQLTIDQYGLNRAPAPYVRACIERVEQDVAHQRLCGNLPHQSSSQNRIGRQFYIIRCRRTFSSTTLSVPLMPSTSWSSR